jgi:hypothetical protein
MLCLWVVPSFLFLLCTRHEPRKIWLRYLMIHHFKNILKLLFVLFLHLFLYTHDHICNMFSIQRSFCSVCISKVMVKLLDIHYFWLYCDVTWVYDYMFNTESKLLFILTLSLLLLYLNPDYSYNFTLGDSHSNSPTLLSLDVVLAFS